jgi:flavin-dependent dehydrogenase
MSRVLVIGAGSAGTTAAWLMAERGLQVTLVDRRPAHRAGALWINGVDLNLLERLDLGPFPDDLAFHRGGRFVMHAGSCDPTDPARNTHNIRQIVDPAPLTETRMDELQKLLQQRALDADVDFRPESVASVGHWDGRQRVASIDGTTSTWDCIVDASGYGGVKSALHEGPHSCAAFQAVYPIVDRPAALRFLTACNVQPGDILSMSGVEGGWSVLNVHVLEDLSHVAILSGAIHANHLRSGARMAHDFVARHPWIGPAQTQGAGLIPLLPLRPVDWIERGLVRIGDAAGQVFPLHGSGIAQGMQAASFAANTISAALQMGDVTEAGLWSYVVAMQRGPARIADSYQPLRCFSQRVRPHELELLMISGIMNANAVRAGLLQHPMPLDPAVALRAIRHARDLLPIAIPVARMLSLTGALLVHGLRIPKRWDTVRIHAWQKKWDQLMHGARRLAAPEATDQGGGPPGR